MLLISTSFRMKMKKLDFTLSACARIVRSYENIDILLNFNVPTIKTR